MQVKDPSTHLSHREGARPGVSGSASIFKHLEAALQKEEEEEEELEFFCQQFSPNVHLPNKQLC